MTLDSVRCIVYSKDGRVLDVMEDVSVGDRVQAIEDGRESLHTAALWAYLAVEADERVWICTSGHR